MRNVLLYFLGTILDKHLDYFIITNVDIFAWTSVLLDLSSIQLWVHNSYMDFVSDALDLEQPSCAFGQQIKWILKWYVLHVVISFMCVQ